MAMLRFIVCAIFTALLSGCASVNFGQSVQSAIKYVQASKDSAVANTIEQAWAGPISLRSDSLDNRPRTVSALKTACEKGLYTEVILYRSQLSTGAVFSNSCVRVFLSTDPNLGYQEVLLIGAQAYTSGSPVSLSSAQLSQEISYRNYLKIYSN